jgi:hypothetical protein
MSARSVASLSGATEATVSVPSIVILLVLAQATDGSSILSPGAASCNTTLDQTGREATRWQNSSSRPNRKFDNEKGVMMKLFTPK